MKINGKVALVTGAAQGNGRGIALRLAKGGADIAVVDLKTDTTGDVAAEIEEPGRKATTFRTDVSDRAEVYAAVEHAEKTVGGLDIMVNNAGIAQVDPIADVTPEDVKLILKINIQGVSGGFRLSLRNSNRWATRARSSMCRRLLGMMDMRRRASVRRRRSPYAR